MQARRFLRALLLRSFVVTLLGWALLAVIGNLPNWWYVVGGVTLLTLLADVLWLSYRLRRDERAAPE